MIDVGSRIGDYEIIAQLRAGGMATLFLGRRKGVAGFARHVAIKVVHPHLAQDPEFVRMFVEEANLSRQIQHPNVVHVEDLGHDGGTYYLVMEYVHGSALSQLLAALARIERRLAPELAVWIAMKAADGLHAAHETRDETGKLLGVVHRDVSPQNILIAANGNVKVIDFGIAKVQGHRARTATGALKGKLRYMSPEQAFGKPLDRRADVYALGVVLWELLTLHRLFSGENELALLDEVRDPHVDPPSMYVPEIHPALDDAVMRALAPDRDHRPETALELMRTLAAACPRAATIDAHHVAEVMNAVLGEELERRRQALPDSLTGMTRQARPAQEGSRPALRPEDVLKNFTASAPGARYVGEGGSPDAASYRSQPSALELAATMAASSPGLVVQTQPGAMSADRKLAIGASVLALVAVVGAGAYLLGISTTSATDPGLTPRDIQVLLDGSVGSAPPAVPDAGAPAVAHNLPDAGADAGPDQTGASAGHHSMRTMRGMEPEPMEVDDMTSAQMSKVQGVPIYDDDF